MKRFFIPHYTNGSQIFPSNNQKISHLITVRARSAALEDWHDFSMATTKNSCTSLLSFCSP
jgi:hypothetical protein